MKSRFAVRVCCPQMSTGSPSPKRLGFFHFTEDFENPLTALRKALDKKQNEDPKEDIGGSLIVLPEAFNYGRPYGNLRDYDKSKDPCFKGKEILGPLQHDFARGMGIMNRPGIAGGRLI